LLLAKTSLPSWLVSRALWLHGFLAIAGMVLLAGHIAMALLTRHGRASLKAMFTGRLSEEAARERHALWWAQGAEAPAAPPDGEPDDGGSG
jgi:cytochrome b subunit of formate dehydrogenase